MKPLEEETAKPDNKLKSATAEDEGLNDLQELEESNTEHVSFYRLSIVHQMPLAQTSHKLLFIVNIRQLLNLVRRFIGECSIRENFEAASSRLPSASPESDFILDPQIIPNTQIERDATEVIESEPVVLQDIFAAPTDRDPTVVDPPSAIGGTPRQV